MDDIDRKLIVLMSENPRMSFQELARRLGISRQAVHSRMRNLSKIGVIKGLRSGISVHYFDAVPVTVSGRSKVASIDETLDRLGDSEFTRRVDVATGNYIYVVGYLRELSELDKFAEFVRRTAEMPEPLVGIYNVDDELMTYPVDGSKKHGRVHRELTPLDFKIIASIKDDARKSVSEIADEVGASIKTVRRHLEIMMSEGSVEFQMPADLTSGGDMFFVMHVSLKEGADKSEVGRRLLSMDYFRDNYMRTYSNIPGLLLWAIWSADIHQVRRALKATSEDEEVHSVMLNFILFERMYRTWLDRLLETATAASEAETRRSTGVRRKK